MDNQRAMEVIKGLESWMSNGEAERPGMFGLEKAQGDVVDV